MWSALIAYPGGNNCERIKEKMIMKLLPKWYVVCKYLVWSSVCLLLLSLYFASILITSLQSPAVQGQACSQTSLLPGVQSDLLPSLPGNLSHVCSVDLHYQPVNDHLFIEKQQTVSESMLGAQVSSGGAGCLAGFWTLGNRGLKGSMSLVTCWWQHSILHWLFD